MDTGDSAVWSIFGRGKRDLPAGRIRNLPRRKSVAYVEQRVVRDLLAAVLVLRFTGRGMDMLCFQTNGRAVGVVTGRLHVRATVARVFAF